MIIRANSREKMAMIRLAAVMEDLHTTAGNTALSEGEGVKAAQNLAMTMLRHFELITTALRIAGR